MMTKDIDFMEILDFKLRWPTKGDTLFVDADGADRSTLVSKDYFTRLVFML